MLPTCTTATEESSVTIHSPTHGPRGRAPRGADEGPAALPLDPPPPPPARHQGAGDDDEQHRRRREHQRATEWQDAGLTRSDPLLDPGPQIRRRLDAARQPARRVEKVLVLGVVLVVVHRSSISRNNRRARNNCALDVPSAIPASAAISSWRYPSMSCSTKTSRAPSGSAAMARSRSIPNPAVAAPAPPPPPPRPRGRRTTSVTPGEEGGGTAPGEGGGRSSVRMKRLRVAAAGSLLRCQLIEDRWNKRQGRSLGTGGRRRCQSVRD